MIIKKEEPWLLWPNKSSHGISNGDIHTTFEGETDFTFSIRFKVISTEPNKRTIFAKLPTYFGLDVENDNNNILFICKTVLNGVIEPKYIFLNEQLGWDYNLVTIRYSKKYNILNISINSNIVYELQLKEGEVFESSDDAHFIFGAGNFPHNNFNLNYSEFDIDFLCISKEYMELTRINELIENPNQKNDDVVGLYDFKEKTEYQIYDFTKNSNLIHRMLDSNSYLS